MPTTNRQDEWEERKRRNEERQNKAAVRSIVLLSIVIMVSIFACVYLTSLGGH